MQRPTTDGEAGHKLAIQAMREIRIRDGRYKPVNEDERRQADEGPIPVQSLDCLATHTIRENGE